MKSLFASRILVSNCLQRSRLIPSTCSAPELRIKKKPPPRMDDDAGKSAHNKTIRSRSNTTISSSTKVEKFQQVFHSQDSTSGGGGGGGGGWQKCWEQGLTPWDLGQPTPVLLHLHETGALPKGRALIPGCGSGYDVVAIAGPERYVVGLEISEAAIEKAMEAASSSPNAEYFEFLKEDFFTWCPTELFDLIFDYTFFCAIEPDMRSSWAVRMRDLLKPDGELITLMFPISDQEGGPPYKVSVANYEEVLHPVGFEAISIVENELAVERRKGAEKIGRWKRSLCQSSL